MANKIGEKTSSFAYSIAPKYVKISDGVGNDVLFKIDHAYVRIRKNTFQSVFSFRFRENSINWVDEYPMNGWILHFRENSPEERRVVRVGPEQLQRHEDAGKKEKTKRVCECRTSAMFRFCGLDRKQM